MHPSVHNFCSRDLLLSTPFDFHTHCALHSMIVLHVTDSPTILGCHFPTRIATSPSVESPERQVGRPLHPSRSSMRHPAFEGFIFDHDAAQILHSAKLVFRPHSRPYWRPFLCSWHTTISRFVPRRDRKSFLQHSIHRLRSGCEPRAQDLLDHGTTETQEQGSDHGEGLGGYVRGCGTSVGTAAVEGADQVKAIKTTEFMSTMSTVEAQGSNIMPHAPSYHSNNDT